MKVIRWCIVLFSLTALINPCLSGSNADATGTWQSSYTFGDVEEVMTANVQQVGNNIIGSYSVEVNASEDDYSGIVFGTIDGGKIEAFYLAIRSEDGGDPMTTISFVDGRMINDDSIQGEFYYRDSDQMELSGPFEATRI